MPPSHLVGPSGILQSLPGVLAHRFK